MHLLYVHMAPPSVFSTLPHESIPQGAHHFSKWKVCKKEPEGPQRINNESRLPGIQAASIFLLRISSDPVNRIEPIPNPIHGVCVKPIIRYPTAHTTATSVA